MQDALTNLDKLWPEPLQHFVLGMEAGVAVGLLILAVAVLTGKVKF